MTTLDADEQQRRPETAILSDFRVRAILSSLPVYKVPGRVAEISWRPAASTFVSGQQSSAGLDKDTSLTGRGGLCSQRLAPHRRDPN